MLMSTHLPLAILATESPLICTQRTSHWPNQTEDLLCPIRHVLQKVTPICMYLRYAPYTEPHHQYILNGIDSIGQSGLKSLSKANLYLYFYV